MKEHKKSSLIVGVLLLHPPPHLSAPSESLQVASHHPSSGPSPLSQLCLFVFQVCQVVALPSPSHPERGPLHPTDFPLFQFSPSLLITPRSPAGWMQREGFAKTQYCCIKAPDLGPLPGLTSSSSSLWMVNFKRLEATEKAWQHRSVLPSPAPPGLPDRFRMFRSCEWEVLERSLNILQASDFYWGPLSVGEAHAKLQREPVGTYLVRDSSQGNCLFSLSVRMPTGPVSLRISFQEGYFRLKNWFSDCVVRLLELVVAGTRNNPLHFDEMGGTPLVFSEPLCRSRRTVPTLRELCQRHLPAPTAAMRTCPQEAAVSPLEGSVVPNPSAAGTRR